MPPRRRPTKSKPYDDGIEDGENTPRFRTLIQHKLPDMPAKFTTAYGAPMSMMPQTPMRGKARDIRSAVDRALKDIHQDSPDAALGEDVREDDEGEYIVPLVRNTVSVDVAEPLPDDPGPGMDGMGPKRPRQVAVVRKDPKIVGKQPAWISMATPETRSRSKTPRAGTQHSPPGDEPAAPKPVLVRPSRFASEPAQDLDSSRSFGNESAVYRDASILSTPGGTAKRPTKTGRRALSEVPRGTLDAVSNMGNAVPTSGSRQAASRQPRRRPTTIQEEEDDHEPSVTASTEDQSRRPSDGDYVPESEDEEDQLAAPPLSVKKRRSSRPQKSDTPPEQRADEDEPPAWAMDEEVEMLPPGRPQMRSSVIAPPPKTLSLSNDIRRPSAAHPSLKSDRTSGSRMYSMHQTTGSSPGTVGQVGSWLRDELTSMVGTLWRMVKMLFWPAIIAMILFAAVKYGPLGVFSFEPLLGRVPGFVPGALRNPLGFLSASERIRVSDLESMFQEKSDLFEKINGFNKRSADKLGTLLPDLVRVDRDKKGNPVVPEDFWHALRSAIGQDGTIMTFDRSSRGDCQVSRDEHWIAIRSRIEHDPAIGVRGNKTAAVDPKEIQAYVNMAASKSFEQWLQSNKQKIASMLGPEMAKYQVPGASKEWDSRREQILKEALQASELKKLVLTKDQFLQLLEEETAKHREDVQNELRRLQPMVEDFIRKTLQVATQGHPPAGMSRDEITTLVGQVVRTAIDEANLGAMANGGLFRLRRQLETQINYFSPHAGAIIDPKRSTPPLSRKTPRRLFSIDYLKSHVRSQYPHSIALKPWQDDGQCFCAVMSTNRKGHNTGVILLVQIPTLVVPTHLVVEHIGPGATADPGARPKGIEVWADFPTTEMKEDVKSWSLKQFPRPISGPLAISPHLEEESYAKIGQFEYESDSVDPKGAQIYKFPEGLKALMAETDALVVRAVSNHGNSNYTCFYRLKLYGEVLEK